MMALRCGLCTCQHIGERQRLCRPALPAAAALPESCWHTGCSRCPRLLALVGATAGAAAAAQQAAVPEASQEQRQQRLHAEGQPQRLQVAAGQRHHRLPDPRLQPRYQHAPVRHGRQRHWRPRPAAAFPVAAAVWRCACHPAPVAAPAALSLACPAVCAAASVCWGTLRCLGQVLWPSQLGCACGCGRRLQSAAAAHSTACLAVAVAVAAHAQPC